MPETRAERIARLTAAATAVAVRVQGHVSALNAETAALKAEAVGESPEETKAFDNLEAIINGIDATNPATLPEGLVAPTVAPVIPEAVPALPANAS